MNSVWFDRIIGLVIGFSTGVLFTVLFYVDKSESCVEKSEQVAKTFDLRLTVKCPLCDESALLEDYTANSALSHTYSYSHKVENGRHWSHYDKNYTLQQASRYP